MSSPCLFRASPRTRVCWVRLREVAPTSLGYRDQARGRCRVHTSRTGARQRCVRGSSQNPPLEGKAPITTHGPSEKMLL